MPVLVNPSNVSFDTIKTDLINYVKSKPNYASWKDFYDSGAGTTLIELLAGFGTYLQFSIQASRRETYLAHAQQRSSVAGISETLGYSISRGTNVHLDLNITPSTTRLVKKMDIIGSYNDMDVVALADYSFTSGVPITGISAVIGNLKTEDLVYSSNDVVITRFISPNVSNDIRLTLEGSEVPHTSNVFDLINDKYVAVSNAVGAVDVMYLNKGGYTQTVGGVITNATVTYPYKTGDTLQLQYIELSEFVWDSNVLVSDYGTVDNLGSALSSTYIAPELLDTARVLAPLRHDTNGVVKGRADFKKLLQIEATALVGDIVNTNSVDTSPAVVNLSYVKSDDTILTSGEKTNLLDILDSYRPFGVAQNTITDPINTAMGLNITITASASLNSVGQPQIDADMASILAPYRYRLAVTVDTDAIEEAVETLSYVKIARVTINPAMTGATIAFVDSDPDTITDSGSGFVSNGFLAGQKINITGSASNDGTYIVDTVSAGTLTLISTDSLTAEIAGSTVSIVIPTAAWNEYFTITEVVTFNYTP